MLSLRVTDDLELKLIQTSKMENKTKSDIVKESLIYYFENYSKKNINAYELGEKYFGTYKSGISDKSINHQKYIKEKIKNKK